MACKRRADLVADLRQKIGLGGARGVRGVPRGDEAALGLALAAQVASKRAELRSFARADARERQRQRNGGAVAIAPDDLKRPDGRFDVAAPAQTFESCGGLGMALGREQHQRAFAGDLVLMIAEQSLGGLVEGQDAACRVEGDGAVGGAVEHRLKVARQTAARRRLALGCAHSRPQLRLQRAP